MNETLLQQLVCLGSASKIKTEWVREWLHEVQLYATTEPVEGYLFVCLQENKLQPLKGRSIPADVRIYCKPV